MGDTVMLGKESQELLMLQVPPGFEASIADKLDCRGPT